MMCAEVGRVMDPWVGLMGCAGEANESWCGERTRSAFTVLLYICSHHS
jgi:hypothetical protein